MSENLIADLEQFMREMAKHDKRRVIVTKPHVPSTEVFTLRENLIKEEVQETLDAMKELDIGVNDSHCDDREFIENRLTEIADGIADSIVVLIGTALAYGIPLQRVWDEVHRSNMDKVTRKCEECLGYKNLTVEGKTICDSCDGTGRIPITPRIRKDGRILKPEGWREPAIKSIIEEAVK